MQNHIGTVHVIAVANALEMAMGFLADTGIRVDIAENGLVAVEKAA